jgi:hypothetical protein
MERDLSTLTRVLSTIDASNHIHGMELRMDALYTRDEVVDWDGWDEVYRVLAGPQFQSLKELYIKIGRQDDRARAPWIYIGEDEPLILISKAMVDQNPPLAARGAEVFFCQLGGSKCRFCWE